ncbi:hypothetical protein ACGFZB_41540 [Streptomyces cinerochromogenes]|uniref:Uncharacterized protein n=1 Tax=Streptomyces cinerochromogenes TaxID=66422 RepID=A0ABW7BL74_9ACTN
MRICPIPCREGGHTAGQRLPCHGKPDRIADTALASADAATDRLHFRGTFARRHRLTACVFRVDSLPRSVD